MAQIAKFEEKDCFLKAAPMAWELQQVLQKEVEGPDQGPQSLEVSRGARKLAEQLSKVKVLKLEVVEGPAKSRDLQKLQ